MSLDSLVAELQDRRWSGHRWCVGRRHFCLSSKILRDFYSRTWWPLLHRNVQLRVSFSALLNCWIFFRFANCREFFRRDFVNQASSAGPETRAFDLPSSMKRFWEKISGEINQQSTLIAEKVNFTRWSHCNWKRSTVPVKLYLNYQFRQLTHAQFFTRREVLSSRLCVSS